MPDVPEFCFQARQFSAGILYIFQGKLTQLESKRQVQMVFDRYETGSNTIWQKYDSL